MGFRPRTPLVIHAYLNRVFIGVFFWVDVIIMGGICLWAYTLMIFSGIIISKTITFAIPVIFFVLGILGMVYVLYWGNPRKLKRRRPKEIELLVERYRPATSKVGPWGWLPPFVVEGRTYYYIPYHKAESGLTGILALTAQGEIVRDMALMDKLTRCLNFALALGDPARNVRRAETYDGLIKAQKFMNNWLADYKNLAGVSGANPDAQTQQDLEQLRAASAILQKNARSVTDNLYLEAQFGAKAGLAWMRECRYEEMLMLAEQISARMSWLPDVVDVLEEGLASAQRIGKRLQERYPKKHKAMPLFAMCETLQNSAELVEVGRGMKEKDMLVYSPMSDDDKNLWLNFLKRVDKRDEKR